MVEMCTNVGKQDKQILTSDRRACYTYKVVVPISFCLVRCFVLFAYFLFLLPGHGSTQHS